MGGISLGYKNAGFEIEEGIDIWDTALKTYGKYIGAKTRNQDISLYYPGRGDFDVIIVGGTPCQDWSLLNKNRDIYGKRGQLVLDYCRIINSVRPHAFMYENVTHMPKWAEQAILDMPGYKVTKNLIYTDDFGIPQRRSRKIFIGTKSMYLTLVPPINPKRFTVRDAFAGIGKNWGLTKHRAATIEKFRAFSSHTWDSKSGSSASYSGTVRLRWDSPSVAITDVSKAQILHPDEDRIISRAEALALQGFPNWYVPFGTAAQQALQISNAVPPPLAEYVARLIRRELYGI